MKCLWQEYLEAYIYVAILRRRCCISFSRYVLRQLLWIGTKLRERIKLGLWLNTLRNLTSFIRSGNPLELEIYHWTFTLLFRGPLWDTEQNLIAHHFCWIWVNPYGTSDYICTVLAFGPLFSFVFHCFLFHCFLFLTLLLPFFLFLPLAFLLEENLAGLAKQDCCRNSLRIL